MCWRPKIIWSSNPDFVRIFFSAIPYLRRRMALPWDTSELKELQDSVNPGQNWYRNDSLIWAKSLCSIWMYSFAVMWCMLLCYRICRPGLHHLTISIREKKFWGWMSVWYLASLITFSTLVQFRLICSKYPWLLLAACISKASNYDIGRNQYFLLKGRCGEPGNLSDTKKIPAMNSVHKRIPTLYY